MWDRLFDYLRQLISLSDNQRQQEREIQALQQQLLNLSQAHAEELRKLRSQIELLAVEQRRAQEREDAERRILKLELENRLLRQERSLPPAKQPPSVEPETNKPEEDEEEAE